MYIKVNCIRRLASRYPAVICVKVQHDQQVTRDKQAYDWKNHTKSNHFFLP